jgi:hypothetical protein
MVGDLIVSWQRAGKTIVSNAPKDPAGPGSAAQQQVRKRFQQAIIYGKAAIAQADTKSAYEAAAQPGQTAYNVAVADFFTAPHIDEIEISKYKGRIKAYAGCSVRFLILFRFSPAFTGRNFL